MHLGRALAHILDCGGMRRTTLRGLENLNKRFKLAAAFYNFSQLMRKLFGIGTQAQWDALKAGALGLFLRGVAVLCDCNRLGNGGSNSPVSPRSQPRYQTEAL